MQRLSSHQIAISQGSKVLFSDFADNGPMWAGTGPRAQRVTIPFEEAYAAPPTVHIALSMWDIDHQHNHRMDISAENVTETEFELVFKTWGDTRVARVRANWMVIGALPYDEEWELY